MLNRKKIISHLSGALMLTGSTAVMFKLWDASKREHEIIAAAHENCSDIIKDSSCFESRGRPVHGTLSSEYVVDKKSGEEYVKKGAHSREDFVKEYLIANFLHLIRKEQPECLIMSKMINKGTAQYFTLSYKFPNSVDVEEFIRDKQGISRLNDPTVQVIGLAAMLIFDHFLGKQSDMKYANMVVYIKNGKLIFITIDHEKAASPECTFLNPSDPIFTLDPDVLVNSIRDLSLPAEDNHAGLAGDPRAQEMAIVIRKKLDIERIIKVYEKTSAVDISPLMEKCRRLATHTRLFKYHECDSYEKHFTDIQKTSADVARSVRNYKNP